MKKFLSSFRRKTVTTKQEQAVGPGNNAKKHVINVEGFDEDAKAEISLLQARIDSTKNYPIQPNLPTSANPFVVNVFLKQPLSSQETTTSQCVIEFRTATVNASVERAPLELCLVLDRSGSMSGEKLTQAKEAISLVVNSSDPRDILHFVIYDTEADVIFRDGKLAQKKKLCESIAGVQARGGTNLYCGLNVAMAILKKSDQGYAKRIFLFSDGQDGGSPTGDALCAEVASWLTQGINTSSFGIGVDFDEVVMKGIAAAGGGGFVYMANSKEIPEKVGKALGALQSLVAKDLNLKIDVSPGVTLTNTYSYSGFSDGVMLGTMSAPDRKQILLQLKINPQECTESKVAPSDHAAAASSSSSSSSGSSSSSSGAAAIVKAEESEEPVPPGMEEASEQKVEGNISQQSEEKGEKQAAVATVATVAHSNSTKIVSAFKWTLTYLDIKTNTEQKREGEALATLTSDLKQLETASEHPLVVVTAVIAESGDRDAAVLDLLNNGSEDAVTRAINIKKQSLERLKAVEHLDDMQAVTWLVKRMAATCTEMESRNDLQKMRQDVSYEHYQASSGLQCAGLV